jgi:hypothetical protein
MFNNQSHMFNNQQYNMFNNQYHMFNNNQYNMSNSHFKEVSYQDLEYQFKPSLLIQVLPVQEYKLIITTTTIKITTTIIQTEKRFD